MADEATPILNANDHPKALKQAEEFVTLFRMALAPVLDAAGDDLPMMQSVAITAGAMFAGMSAGHMLAFGVLDASKGDREQAKLCAMAAFDSGVEMGLKEALSALARAQGGKH